MGLRAIPLLAMLVALGACAGLNRPSPEWSSAPDADIPALSTYAWDGGAPGETRTVMATRLRHAVDAQLQDKGYRQVPENADFLISYEVVEHDSGQRSSPVRVGIGVGTWGRRVGGSVGTSVGLGGGDPGQSYRLVIRAVDPEANRELWVGATTSFEAPPDEAVIDRVTGGVMRGFPARND